MRLLVRMAMPSIRHGRRWMENYQMFECLVVRLRGPVHELRDGKNSSSWIYADVELPQQYREYALLGAWNADGTYRVEVVVNHNRKSLAPFLTSGDLEWDVRGWNRDQLA